MAELDQVAERRAAALVVVGRHRREGRAGALLDGHHGDMGGQHRFQIVGFVRQDNDDAVGDLAQQVDDAARRPAVADRQRIDQHLVAGGAGDGAHAEDEVGGEGRVQLGDDADDVGAGATQLLGDAVDDIAHLVGDAQDVLALFRGDAGAIVDRPRSRHQ